ncbi:amidohydrolase family protein [Yinghuangia seranimata]|uniref:amidohydrolase family protein n=1 Tax=Yinghuangia seranimata TaxID=408067 RepID=UPI00248AD8B2|nr:amidohydrolase family protein [Yinghuangia seranimata]MDI2127570.1 amidohydrolase family protein [Yinghuangia seranimata]
MFEVLDCHHHVGDVHGSLGLGPGAVKEAADGEVAARVATMDRNGVDRAVVIPGHGYLRPAGLADTRRVNDAIAAYRDAVPDRFAAALGIVEPLYGPAGLAEVDRIADELGLRGVSLHTRFQGVSTDSPLVRAVVERCAERGLVPFLHALAEVADEALWKVQRLGRDFPETTFVVLDAFSSFEQARQAVEVAEVAPNLVFDTSLAYTFDLIEPFVRAHGASRLVFGTDLYSAPLGYRRTHVLGQVLEADLPDEDKRLILAGNIRAILGLEAE